jgi:sugar porter (SP) family MFS transporter
VGAALQAASRFLPSAGVACLLLGRVVYGAGIGISMHGAPTYLAEMGPSNIRGLLVSLKEASIVLGILMGYVLGFAFSHTAGGWAWTYACSSIVSVFMLIVSMWIPCSCRWLLLQGRDEEALDSIRFVFFEEVAVYEFEAMRRLHESTTTDLATSGGPNSIWHPSRRAPLLAGVGLVILQQITGQPSVLSYATPIFRDAGLSDYASVLVAAFKLVATLSAAVTVEKFGRKKLLYTGCTLMLVALVTLAFSFGREMPGLNGIILLSMFIYIGGYQLGFGPISWLIISEVFPLSVRGQAVALSVQMNFLLNAVVQFGVPVLESAIGLKRIFGIFAFWTVYR